MTPTTPTITARDAQVAVILLDTRVGGRYLSRDAWRKAGVPIPLTARRVAVRLSEAAGQTITADELIAGVRALSTRIPTHELRAIAAEVTR